MKTVLVMAFLATSFSLAATTPEPRQGLPTPTFLVAADDNGCCVAKKSAARAQWECLDDTRRDACAQLARELVITTDFYKDKRCSEVSDCK